MNKLTICQCCEYLATMINDKELLKTIDYIEERATAMYNKLVERKAQVEKLECELKGAERSFKLAKRIAKEKIKKCEDYEKALNKACELLEDLSRFTPKGSIIRTKEEWKEWCLDD